MTAISYQLSAIDIKILLNNLRHKAESREPKAGLP